MLYTYEAPSPLNLSRGAQVVSADSSLERIVYSAQRCECCTCRESVLHGALQSHDAGSLREALPLPVTSRRSFRPVIVYLNEKYRQ